MGCLLHPVAVVGCDACFENEMRKHRGPDSIRPLTERPKRVLEKADYSQIEMRVVFMAGWDACFAKRDGEGNVPPDADDRADAQKAFEDFVRKAGPSTKSPRPDCPLCHGSGVHWNGRGQGGDYVVCECTKGG